MNKKIKFFILASCLVLSGCRVAGIGSSSSSSSSYLEMDNYHMYIPGDINDEKNLIFAITSGGEERAVKDYIKRWKLFADKNNYIVVSPLNWNQEILLSSLAEVLTNHKIGKVIVTGHSNGGYNACRIGLSNTNIVDAVIPMGAYCGSSDVIKEENNKIPILVVVGEKDFWARGEDGKNIDYAIKDLASLGYRQEEVLVPGAGHDFDFNVVIGKIEKWIAQK